MSIQCPKCGVYKVFSTSWHRDQNTGKKVGGQCSGCFLAFLLTVSSIVVLEILFGIISSSLIPFGSLGLVPGVAFYIYFLKKNQEIVDKSITVYDSECKRCGYTWRWDEGHPVTDIQVRPDLIQRGAQKLEEDRARTAAYYWE